MLEKNFFAFLVVTTLAVQMVSGAHFVVGFVNNATDGTFANDHTVMLWNPLNGTTDNKTDIVGTNGNSGTEHVYMIDCELLSNGCNVGDVLSLRIIDNGDSYVSYIVNVTITGAGFDIAPNITLNSPPNITSVIVDDSLTVPLDHIDLIAASNRSVNCTAVVDELDGDSIFNASAEFYDGNSFYGGTDDNNSHYGNDSCYVDYSYGGQNESQVICSFDIAYYADPGSWECFVHVEDNYSIQGNETDLTTINTLLSIGVPSLMDYGIVNVSEVSNEVNLNITNYGNVMVNISLSGYAYSVGDGWAMNCSLSDTNVSIEHEKYNLSASNSGTLDLGQTGILYKNLTSSPEVRKFNLESRKDDSSDALNETYWRVYAPAGIMGTCQGNIVFGASQAEGT